jgi:hypothetical protein
VYGPTPDAELHLITCGGTFDYATRSYLSNILVYATPLAPPASRPSAGRPAASHPRRGRGAR